MTERDGVNDRPNAPGREEDSIAPHLVRPLRAAERVDSTFTARVMSAVHAESRRLGGTGSRRSVPAVGWWRRPRTIHLSPLGGLAIAAGVAALVVFGSTWRGARLERDVPVTALARDVASPDTVHIVRFVFTDREAKSVSLVGDFNAWSREATPLVEESRDGTWVVSVELPGGRHEYAFVVRRGDEEHWAADPNAPPVLDDFGTESSVVIVRSPGTAAALSTTS
ncbi:MAG: isoamylase early set domain-containing protein [Gemmatimonadaceae bacterium]